MITKITIDEKNRIWTNMLPYYCNERGGYLDRSDIHNPSTIPHILVRIMNNHSTAFGVIIDDDGMRFASNSTHLRDEDLANSINDYIKEEGVSFLGEIRATCARCLKVIGPPGAISRSNKDRYTSLHCADCSQPYQK